MSGKIFAVVFLLVFLTILTCLPLFAQEIPSDQGDDKDGNQIVYFIREIDFNITGRTLPFALLHTLDIKTGERLRSLDTYIRRKTQILRNQRVLEEDQSRIEYFIGEAGADGLVPVDLMIYVTDTWNIIALPEPKYDSNTGLSLTVKARDYNFLGTMSPLAVDLGYSLEENKNSFFMDLDSEIPFKFLGYNWIFDFDNSINFTQKAPFFYQNTTGISMELPWRRTAFTFGFEQAYMLNEENDDKEKRETGVDYFADTWYMSSELYTQWDIPTGLELGEFGELAYFAKLAAQIKYRPGGDIGEYRRGPTNTFSHGLDIGQINWQGNYRSGIELSLKNTNQFNYSSLGWDNSLIFSAVGHFPISPRFGISSRFLYRQYFNSPYMDAGDVLRGMRNNALYANYMLSLNIDLPFRLFFFIPSAAFNNRKLRALDFEVHFSPFFDIAVLDGPDPYMKDDYTIDQVITTAGFEFIVYPLSWRSLYFRGSIGWNMREWLKIQHPPGGDYQEIYIGIGHFF
ncbi:MAG: hypothetical protein LBB68_04625 [Treponema sp.]|jgi:hypothetical protein|nr:hypothetical protein [Treponema sp.]